MDNSKEVYCVLKKGSPPPPVDESSEENERREVLLQFISEMLMQEEEEEEEELGNNKLHHGLALQAIEKSLHDALHDINLDTTSPKSLESNYGSGVKKNNYRSREDGDPSKHHMMRSHKQSANNNDDDESEMYEDVLLCPDSSSDKTCGQTKANKKASHRIKQSKRGPRRKSKGGDDENDVIIDEKKFIDLKSLLMQCAQALAKVDNKAVNDLLWVIRRHSSPIGDDMERLAHYFANALEARLAFTTTDLCAPLDSKERISAAEILKAYKLFIITCPFRYLSNFSANATINSLLTTSAPTTLHIVDFGIRYGFQWPCLMHTLSQRPGGPPKLRITGIDFPQPGFRPEERVADTGRRLAKWADRFGVPLEYNAIAQKWDTIRVEDLKIENNELVVVNCMHRLHNVPDETEMGVDSPRDDVLNLIKKINPEMFIHGVAHGTYNTPFFVPRFKEALFHFSALFDMFDATMPKDDENRLLYEKQIFGKEVMNIIACEGTERFERPDTCRQWQRRTARAGFRQVSIDQEIVKKLRKVNKRDYHTSFTVDDYGEWVLLGWKGRVIQGISCWRPILNSPSS